MDLEKELQSAEKTLGVTSNRFFKPKEGDNKIRILSKFVPYRSVYNGQETKRLLCYVLDYSDNEIKPYTMPITIAKMLVALQKNEDWKFDSFPMPYGININAKGAGTKEVEYNIIPSPKRIELPVEVLNKLKEKVSIEELRDRLESKNAPKERVANIQDDFEVPPPTEEWPSVRNDDIPF